MFSSFSTASDEGKISVVVAPHLRENEGLRLIIVNGII